MFFILLAVPYVSDSVHCVGDGDIVRLCVSNERHCYSSRHWCNTSLYLQSLSGFVQVKAAVGFVLSHQLYARAKRAPRKEPLFVSGEHPIICLL